MTWHARFDAVSDLRNAGGDLVAPHGGTLVRRWIYGREALEVEASAAGLPRLRLDARRRSDLELIANGAFSPLTGFLTRDDVESVLTDSRLSSGAVWTIPIVLPVEGLFARGLSRCDRVALYDEDDNFLGRLDLQDVFHWKADDFAGRVFGTTDLDHPGVARLHEQGDWYLGGPVSVVRRPLAMDFPQYHRDPVETRALIRSRGWKSVVGFQTRNPIHRAHEFILKSALELFDALLIQPLVGETRAADIPADVRLRCYEVLLDKYYPADRTLLSVLPAVMRFAGPREAIFHALVRKNYGCTHFIVGRDHAGVGGYYGPYDAQRRFDAFPPEDIGIVPLRFENTFYCGVCEGMASLKTCPHDSGHHLSLSGTRVREMLARNEAPPAEFTRPEVARILMDSFAAPGPRPRIQS